MQDILFGLVIFVSHIIHGITGFAGTMLAIPPGILLVGYGAAKPILNLLGLLAAVYITVRERQHILWREIVCAIVVMGGGIFAAGQLSRKMALVHSQFLYIFLGLFLIVYALFCMLRLYMKNMPPKHKPGRMASGAVLFLAGVVHGLYVSGGPFLSAYMAHKSEDRSEFRATISVIWVFMNGMILLDDLRAGAWSAAVLSKLGYALPCCALAMAIGTYLCRRVSQRAFLLLTYLLFLVSGAMLLLT